MGALARAARRHRVHQPAHQPHRARARGRVPHLVRAGASHRHGHRRARRCSCGIDVETARPSAILGRRRNTRAYARSRSRSQGEELPLVVQRTGPHSARRPSRDRGVRRRARQPQRSDPLPRHDDRASVPVARSSPRRWRLPRHPRAKNARVSRATHPSRPRMATASTTTSARRACHCQAQGLASAPRPPSPRQAPHRITSRCCAAIQPQHRIARQLLVEPRLGLFRQPTT